ncbi:polyamine transporter protein [Rutstroemia sp. NJR-2017a BVV2]|nr:polyamine transporter protein [Rutstroemia sp. NJR-2017a BVV2]
MSMSQHHPSPPLEIVTFQPGDPHNPRNFSFWRKWAIVSSITLVDLTVSWGASGYSPATTKLRETFHVSSEIGVLGLSLYVLGLAFGPMTLAPLSEYYGRTYLYVVPYGIFLLFLLGTALVQSIGGFLVLRFFSGLFASVTIANFGGTIADLWPRDQIGPAMSIFLWAAVCGSPSGYLLMSFVAQTRGWRDVFWALLGICGGFWLILVVVLVGFKNETRHSVLLRRRAARLNKESGAEIATVPPEMQRKSLGQLLKGTLSRPFVFLAKETVIIFAALYNGFLYGISFLFNGAFNLVFGEKGYGFNEIGVGLAFLGLIVGISLGPIINILQERYYQKRIRAAQGSTTTSEESLQVEAGQDRFKNIPEARVQLSKIAAVLLPISLFWFAWTSPPQYHIHWIVPILATSLFGYSFYTLILMTYLYVEDSYMVFSASALAGVGLIRNLAGAGFPLFGSQMFENEGYNWAGSILAFLAMVLVPIPFILEKWGPRIRARSPWARQHMDDNDDDNE